MKSTRWIGALLLFSLALAVRAGTPTDVRQNYAARGVILEEKNGFLLLTTTPCAGDAYKQILRFRMPYQKTPASRINCEGKSYPQFIVRQQ